jgi:hypothetical protein
LPATDATIGCISNPSPELAGDLPVEVAFAMTQSDSQKFLDLLAPETLSLFYIRSPCEFGRVGE